jgi:hypothetical protein
MKVVLITAALMVVSGAAQAAIPAFALICGEKIEVAAVEGGPITIKGKEAKIKVQKENYYEVKRGKITAAITIGADDAVSATYTTKKGETGTCTAKP